MHGHLIRWAVYLLLPVFLSSCASTDSFDSISDAYSYAQKRFFPDEKTPDNPAVEDPVVEELRLKLQDSERENEMLSNNINNLEREIEKKELTILLQGKVIKLLDDSSQTLQKNIEEQIAAQSFDNDTAASIP